MSSAFKAETVAVPKAVVADDYQPIVQELYIAYFGRPADPQGLANFAAQLVSTQVSTDIQQLDATYSSNPTIRTLVDSFGNSDESKALYTGDTTSFVTSIYRNILSRTPDAEGLNFWVTAIDNGTLTRAHAAFSMMAGALANQTTQGQIDAALVNRRVQAASSFTSALTTPELKTAYQGNTAAAIARDMLATITNTSDASAIQSGISLTLPLLTQAATAPTAGELPAAVPAATLTMSCIDGPSVQCSGDTVLRTENGVALTGSGVQAHGRSTSDLAVPNLTMTGAFGLAAATAGMAEVRLTKDVSGTVSTTALLLKDLGLSWDGNTERPPIIETFRTAQGHVQLGSNGALASIALPPSTDLSFYNYATTGTAATQANYANNAYFPRTDPSRCSPGTVPCPTVETAGVRFTAGDWKSGGNNPDMTNATRLHEDGDIHAGNGVPNADGSATLLPGATGTGVPFPGAKGYREIFNWGLRYANLSTWLTQDTVQMGDWGAIGDEHNKNRRGVVAFGAVTDPAIIPASGSATYSGLVYGWEGGSNTLDPDVFRGVATITVDFATRRVNISFTKTATYDSANAYVAIPSYVAAAMGTTGTNVANYFKAGVTTTAFTGGLSGRFFGPLVSTGTSGVGPAEIGGALTLTSASTSAAMIGGFIGWKQ
ncbi:DUF4214 domain-containing protein [Herbaspirillum sp. ST 5-3]|uniref:DUF4214 domain-containing protein n=1 Tax=Oxalobacteraceae TaxID=75682 RepID=UPI001455DD54|nr:DUF4214 domain-containing protein [Herbaspirillum sp. ST 5-3]